MKYSLLLTEKRENDILLTFMAHDWIFETISLESINHQCIIRSIDTFLLLLEATVNSAVNILTAKSMREVGLENNLHSLQLKH